MQMDSFSIKNLIELINEVGEQDDSAEIRISMENLDTGFDDLGVDSLTFLSVVAQLESRYGIRIGLGDAMSAKSPAELFELVQKCLVPA
jgi:acyl carrier protein